MSACCFTLRFYVTEQFLSLNPMNQILLASSFSSAAFSPLSAFMKLKWFRALLWLKSESVSHSVVSDSLQTLGLQPSRLLCPWDFPGKNTEVGSHSLLQGIFLTQGLNPDLPSKPPGRPFALIRIWLQEMLWLIWFSIQNAETFSTWATGLLYFLIIHVFTALSSLIALKKVPFAFTSWESQFLGRLIRSPGVPKALPRGLGFSRRKYSSRILKEEERTKVGVFFFFLLHSLVLVT